MESSEWTGRVGDVWAEEWRRTDRSFVPVDAELTRTAFACVADVEAPQILDIGCGAGTTSLALARHLPDARIIGIDLSLALLDVARTRAQDMPQCRFVQADASRWTGEAAFDLLVSRHGVMFFADPVAAFTHLRGLARPGGRLVFSCFRAPSLNRWASGLASFMPPGDSDPSAPGPFAFADEGRVRDILARAGWRAAGAQAVDYGYVAGEGDDPVADALGFFLRIGPVARAARELDDPGRARLLGGLDALVREYHEGNRVSLPAAAWIWSAIA